MWCVRPPRRPACLIVVLLLGAGLPALAQGPPRYPLLWDPAFSSEVGAENLATARRGLMALEHRLLPLRWTDEHTAGEKALGVAYRLGRLAFLERPLTWLTWVTQHEVFGHGAAARQAGVRGTRYEVGLPWPYGNGGGRAFYPDDASFSTAEALHATANGANSGLVLARTVRDRALQRGAFFYDEVGLGVSGHVDLPLYILSTDSRADRGDIATYLRQIDGAPPTLASLKRKAWLGLADPVLLLAVGSSLRNHLWRGASTAPLPTIEWRSVRYLPSFHLSLSPFGPEFLLEHLALHDGRLWRITTRLGDGPHGRFGGAGIAVTNVLRTRRLRTDLRLDVWYQPTLLPGEPSRAAAPRSPPASTIDLFALGARTEVSAAVRAAAEWPVFVTGTLGYKTDGFVLGEGLDAGILVEVGLRLEAGLLE